MIDREGLGRHLEKSCAPKQAGAEAKTDLDFVLGYVPAGVNGDVSTVKWLCGGQGLSVLEQRNFDATAGTLDVERALWGPHRAADVDVPRDRVESCTVGGKHAVCVHPEDDASGRGSSYVFVIEDDTMDPYATLLRIMASELPWSEVLKVANSIR